MTSLGALLADAEAIVATRWPPSEAAEPTFTVTGIGWATVERERAEAELSEALAIPRDAWSDGRRDVLLGAAVRLVHVAAPAMSDGAVSPMPEPGADGASPLERPAAAGAVSARSIALLVLEPDTEGRIAASLARSGEGIAVAYVVPLGTPPHGLVLSSRADGPLGPARLAVAGRSWGPHLVLVAR